MSNAAPHMHEQPVAGGAPGWWRRLGAVLPMRLALVTVAGVWLLGCVWSFQEQTEFAAYLGFVFPRLLPLVIDGFAVSMATVAWAASLDARPAVAARLATLVAVGASSTSNGVWAWLRVTHTATHNPITVTVAVTVPVLANLAFEVLLAELRRQVQRRRGQPAPVAVPYPRLIRLVLAPASTFTAWRRHVLDLTATDTAAGTGTVPVCTPEPRPVTPGASGHSLALARARRELAAGQPPTPPDESVNEPDDTVAPEVAAEESCGPGVGEQDSAARGGALRMALDQIDRARVSADLHWRRTGQWPSVRELEELANVGRGTAHRALKELRDTSTERPCRLVSPSTEVGLGADPDADSDAAAGGGRTDSRGTR